MFTAHIFQLVPITQLIDSLKVQIFDLLIKLYEHFLSLELVICLHGFDFLVQDEGQLVGVVLDWEHQLSVAAGQTESALRLQSRGALEMGLGQCLR